MTVFHSRRKYAKMPSDNIKMLQLCRATVVKKIMRHVDWEDCQIAGRQIRYHPEKLHLLLAAPSR